MDYDRLLEDLKKSPLVYVLGAVDNLRFVVKDREHRCLYVNRIWQESFAFSDEEMKKVIGKTAEDLFPKWRAQRYIREEEQVMQERRIYDYEEYHLNADGVVERWRTIKAPWIVDDEVIGYINLGTRMGLMLEQRKDQLPSIVHEIVKHACGPESIEQIAQKMHISRRTLERRFREIMNETPQQFRMRCKLARAKHLLAQGEKVINVAEACGFNDQSHFSKAFRKNTGQSPKKYQQQIQKAN